jgi:hypothetical protein
VVVHPLPNRLKATAPQISAPRDVRVLPLICFGLSDFTWPQNSSTIRNGRCHYPPILYEAGENNVPQPTRAETTYPERQVCRR